MELLKELHLLTRDGQLNQDARRKLKQVNHLCQFIAPLLEGAATLVDHGAGKSYLGFLLYDLYLRGPATTHLYGVEARPALVEKSQALAARLGFARAHFLALTVAEAMQTDAIPATVDVVTALHACDTATDDALRFALARDARHVVLVPCCQAEVAAVMRGRKAEALARGALAELWRHPIHTRELGSHLTNTLRCLLLEAHGYDVTVTELVGFEHSMKNELILASRRPGAHARKNARTRAAALLREFHLDELAPRFLYDERGPHSPHSPPDERDERAGRAPEAQRSSGSASPGGKP